MRVAFQTLAEKGLIVLNFLHLSHAHNSCIILILIELKHIRLLFKEWDSIWEYKQNRAVMLAVLVVEPYHFVFNYLIIRALAQKRFIIWTALISIFQGRVADFIQLLIFSYYSSAKSNWNWNLRTHTIESIRNLFLGSSANSKVKFKGLFCQRFFRLQYRHPFILRCV